MKSMRVRWYHDEDDDPVELYSEVDERGWEVRKVERWRDGQVGHAGGAMRFGPTRLGEEPVPVEKAEINDDPQFDAQWIEPSEFEDVWDAARRVTVPR